MTVVNWVQLDVVLPADAGGMNVLTLLLAREADREEMAAEFFRLRSTPAIERQYQERLQEAGQDKARLLRELEQAKALASQTAQDLAKVRPGQSSPLYEEAMRLVAEGKVDEALSTLDEAKLRARSQEAKKQLRETARDWALRGSLLATKFRFAEAEAAYRSAVETAPDDFERRFEFGLFLQSLNRHQAAREQYERCLALAGRSRTATGLPRRSITWGMCTASRTGWRRRERRSRKLWRFAASWPPPIPTPTYRPLPIPSTTWGFCTAPRTGWRRRERRSRKRWRITASWPPPIPTATCRMSP